MPEFNSIPTVKLAREVQPIANSLAALRELPSLPAPRELPHLGHVKHKGLHTGPIHSPVAGRTDHLPAEVPNGSYVLPADIVSSMGEGNTISGFRVAKRMFEGVPYNGGASEMPYGQGSAPYGGHMPHAQGGMPEDNSRKSGVAVVVAGGEHVLTPEEVAWAGDGDMEAGHKALDEFVRRMRAKHIKTLQKLPGPRND